MPLVLILGGGFAGVAAAHALRRAQRRRQCRVILLDPRGQSVMLPLLPEYAAGRLDRRRLEGRLERRLPAGIDLRQTAAEAVDLDARTVDTPAGKIAYDYLICAAGSVSRPGDPAQFSGPTFPMADIEEAERIRCEFPRYLARASTPHCLFHGAGYTALELAANLADTARRAHKTCRFTLVERNASILPFLSAGQAARVQRWLTRNDFDLLVNDRITLYDGKSAHLASGRNFADVFLCRTEGTTAAINRIKGRIKRLPDGRVIVNEFLAAPGYPAVFFAGDAAAVQDRKGYLRKAVNFSIYAGARAGANIARALAGQPPRRFYPLDLGWVIPLADDSVGRAFDALPLCGRTGLRLHYFMCGLRNFSFLNFMFFAKHALAPRGWRGAGPAV